MTVFGETMGISFLIPAAQCDLDLSTSDKGLLSGMAFFGKLFFISFTSFECSEENDLKIRLISSFNFAIRLFTQIALSQTN